LYIFSASVTDVDKINEETAGPLSEAEGLKFQADMARKMAAEKLTTAENVTKSLEDAEDAQNAAEAAITSAQSDIASARKDLAVIEADMEAATGVSDETFQRTEDLVRRQKSLQTAFIANDNHVKSAQTAAEMAMNKANKASSDLYKLNADFFNVSTSLTAKSDKIGRSKDRALDLQKRANNLANSASSKLASLLDMEKEYEDNQRQLDILSTRLIELNCKMQIHLLVSSLLQRMWNINKQIYLCIRVTVSLP
jgi:chromosome segregation ATPase